LPSTPEQGKGTHKRAGERRREKNGGFRSKTKMESEIKKTKLKRRTSCSWSKGGGGKKPSPTEASSRVTDY